MVRQVISIVALVFVAVSCATTGNSGSSQAVVTSLSPKAAVSESSLIYALPLTVLDIEIEAERIIEKPGPYSKYAAEFLGLTDVIRAEAETWNITALTVGTHEELDPGHFYAIEAHGIFLTNVLELKRSGLILDLNPEIYEYTARNKEKGLTDYSSLHTWDLGSDEYFLDRKDTIYKVVNIDTAFVRIPYLVEKKQKLGLDQLAEKAAIRLMELRDGKHLILTGETNVFPQSEAALNEINRLEKEYTELFTGKTLREKQTFKYQIIPAKEMTGKKTPLCIFSEADGPSNSQVSKGIPVEVEFIPEMKAANLKINYAAQSGKQQDSYGKLYYRVPDVVNIRVYLGNEILSTSRKLVYQFGEVIRMPQNYILGK